MTNSRALVTFDSQNLTTTTLVVDGTALIKDEFLDLNLNQFEKSYKSDVDGLRKVDLTISDWAFINLQLRKDYALKLRPRATV